ncbi:MAG: Cro/CI family transcriptional regulator [Janthinobacterium lividum]
MRDAALTSALEKANGPSALARQLGITPTAVIQWERVPAARVLDVERCTGISRNVLRPDIFGPAPSDSASSETTRSAA